MLAHRSITWTCCHAIFALGVLKAMLFAQGCQAQCLVSSWGGRQPAAGETPSNVQRRYVEKMYECWGDMFDYVPLGICWYVGSIGAVAPSASAQARAFPAPAFSGESGSVHRAYVTDLEDSLESFAAARVIVIQSYCQALRGTPVHIVMANAVCLSTLDRPTYYLDACSLIPEVQL